MTTDILLVKVKTLSKSHAKQIDVIHGTSHRLWREVSTELFKGPDGTLQPLGWTWAMNIGFEPAHTEYWLIEWTGQLFWFPAPGRNHSLYVTWTEFSPIPQIFV